MHLPMFLGSLVGSIGYALLGTPVVAQAPVTLSAVLTTFLADSGVRVRGLAWTTGDRMPIRWSPGTPNSDGGMAAETRHDPEPDRQRPDSMGEDSLAADVVALGTEGGIQQLQVWVRGLDSQRRHTILEEIRRAGIALQPLRCAMETEGESFGNVVYVAKAPGKTASGLHLSWNCAHDGCAIGASILYRRRDVSQVECATPG